MGKTMEKKGKSNGERKITEEEKERQGERTKKNKEEREEIKETTGERTEGGIRKGKRVTGRERPKEKERKGIGKGR
jgi:hypothetical protein